METTKTPMKARAERATTFNETAVPQLDIARQNAALREEIRAAIDSVCDSGRFIHGPPCQQFEEAMASYCGTRYAVGCASGSDALRLALMAQGVGRGDEVLLPSFTFFATAGAVWHVGAKPVFVDIDPATFNIDPTHAESVLTERTKAIIPVHLFGQCANMTAVTTMADKYGLSVIEDAAQAIGAEHESHRAGSMGEVGCFSFYPSKNLGGFGDGGVLTTNDSKFAETLRVLRDHGQQPRYIHSIVGINSRLDSIQAAVLHVKISYLESWTASRQARASAYGRSFRDRGLDRVLTLPTASPSHRHVWNQYTIRVPDGRRDDLKHHLDAAQIGTAVYYPQPLHLQECFSSLGYVEGSLPETERAASEVLSLPIFPELTDAEQQRVVGEISTFLGERTTKYTK